MLIQKKALSIALTLLLALGAMTPATYAASSKSAKDSSQSSSETKTKKQKTAELNGTAPQQEVAEKAALLEPLVNYASVSIDALQSAAKVTKNSVMFDTKLDNRFLGRLTIPLTNLDELSGEINTGIHVRTGDTQEVVDRFAQYFSNRLVVVKCDQLSYNTYVELAVYVGDMKDYQIYTYDDEYRIYEVLAVANDYVDDNGYLHFYTNNGGYLLISEGPLTKISKDKTKDKD